MTKDELIERLRRLNDIADPEEAHVTADALVIEYIGDADISAAYNDIDKWYA